MSISQRLAVQRYSKLNIRTPSEEDLLAAGFVKRKFKTTPEKRSRLRSILTDPIKKDKYYIYGEKISTDYYDNVDKQPGARTEAWLYYHQIVRKLAFFLYYPQYYGGSYQFYGIALMFNIQMFMRSYTMRCMGVRGEIPKMFRTSNPKTSGYYRFPKPMRNPATSAWADQVYELAYDDAMKEIEYLQKKGYIK